MPLLKPGQEQKAVFEKKFEKMAGSFPAVLVVDYHDDADYPFSALHCAIFSLPGYAATPDLVGKAQDATLAPKGDLVLEIQNRASAPRRVKAGLVLPRELACKDKIRSVNIGPQDSTKLDFEVENKFAMSGSTYPVYCIMEFDEKNAHHTSMAGAVLTVAEQANWFSRSRFLWMGLLAVFAVLLAGVAIFGRRRGGNGA
jgi:hypothetical protein